MIHCSVMSIIATETTRGRGETPPNTSPTAYLSAKYCDVKMKENMTRSKVKCFYNYCIVLFLQKTAAVGLQTGEQS